MSEPPGLLLRSVAVYGGPPARGEEPLVDVRVRAGRVAEIGVGLAYRAGEEVIEGDGGALLPGLHDHHLHLLALAASLTSVHLGPPAVRTRQEFVAALTRADRQLPPGEWLRGWATTSRSPAAPTPRRSGRRADSCPAWPPWAS